MNTRFAAGLAIGAAAAWAALIALTLIALALLEDEPEHRTW